MYNPPIEHRSDHELRNIVSNPDDWQSEVIEIANNELIKRGVKPPKGKKKTNTPLNKKVGPSEESLSWYKIVLAILVGPIFLMLALGHITDYWWLKSNNSKTEITVKEIQEIFYSVVGLGLWLIVLYAVF